MPNEARGLDDLVARILHERAATPEQRGLLVGVSGIDGCGKGYIAQQLEARLGLHAMATANINVDGWLNLPHKRFSPVEPGRHFYENAIRSDEMFAKLILPLRNHRSVEMVADFAEERATHYRNYPYKFKNVVVVLVEGIFLFKRELRDFFDLAIWVNCSFETALARAITRAQEGLPPAETIRAYETIYFPAQRIHLDRDRPREGADLIIENDSFAGTNNPYYKRGAARSYRSHVASHAFASRGFSAS